MVRQAFAEKIENFDRVSEVKQAANGQELLDMIQEQAPDVVIIDLQMPVLNGTKTCERIANDYPEIRIIIVSENDSKLEIYHHLLLGAHTYLLKSADMEEFERAIYAIVDHGIYRNDTMNKAINYGMAQGKAIRVELTNREKEVLQCIAAGLSTKEISEKFGLSENTVRNQRENIKAKAKVKKTAELIRWAIENRLIKE